MHPNNKSSLLNFKGKKILITAGPTYEPIDPVRFIGNYSTGKMGFSLADALYKTGAEVNLVSGPSCLSPKYKLHKHIKVHNTKEMFDTCIELFPACNIAILAAAVADYRPVKVENQKIKSKSGKLILTFERTEDIAFELGKLKKNGQILVGFALETENELANAREKLRKKNLDFVVLNSLRDRGAGFGFETNKITILDSDNKISNFGLKLKEDIAYDILQVISQKIV
jgi:phosphopantothenoylcysteine decarboxylase/phosphopantothenate--cysteine ligase